MKYSNILLDVDADFMLDEDYSWFHCFPEIRKKSKIVISGKELGRALKRFVKKDTDIYLETDHHESLYWWDSHCITNALCMHIDAHHDMWDCYRSGNREYIDCGNYLQQALNEGIIERVIYIPSEFRCVSEQRGDIVANLTKQRLRKNIKVSSWKVFQKNVKDYPQADIITLSVSPEWFPQNHWKHFEDLAMTLGATSKDLLRVKSKANKKWSKMRDGNMPNNFKFPYSDTYELEMS